MGSVYRARDLHFPNVTKLVAVKEMVNLAPDPKMRETIVQNFEREANILATLTHPSIPSIFDYFSSEDRSYLVLEYINGSDLETVINNAESFLTAAQVVSGSRIQCQPNRSPQGRRWWHRNFLASGQPAGRVRQPAAFFTSAEIGNLYRCRHCRGDLPIRRCARRGGCGTGHLVGDCMGWVFLISDGCRMASALSRICTRYGTQVRDSTRPAALSVVR